MTIPRKLLSDPTLSDYRVAKTVGVKKHTVTLARHQLLFETVEENARLLDRAKNAEALADMDLKKMLKTRSLLEAAANAMKQASAERDDASCGLARCCL